MNNAEMYKEKIRELIEDNNNVEYLQGVYTFAFYYQPDKQQEDKSKGEA